MASDPSITGPLARDPRVDSLERHVDEVRRDHIALREEQAAQRERDRELREDVRDLVGTMRATNEAIGAVNGRVREAEETFSAGIADAKSAVNDRFRRLGWAVWTVAIALAGSPVIWSGWQWFADRFLG